MLLKWHPVDDLTAKHLHLSIALVRNPRDDMVRWLATWNESKKVFDFIIGQRLQNESFRETVTRETAWALNLDRSKDFIEVVGSDDRVGDPGEGF